MDPKERLTNAFKIFPGIGNRQAQRFVYFLLSRGAPFSEEMAKEMKRLHDSIARCEMTHQHFQKTDENQTKSPLARDPERDRSKILVVESDMDLEAIERTASYNGMYYVLETAGSLTNNDLEKMLGLDAFKAVIDTFYDNSLEEIIIATSVTPEGERAKETIARYLDANLPDSITISSLGRGLSTGSELEYIDDDTFKHALESRS